VCPLRTVDIGCVYPRNTLLFLSYGINGCLCPLLPGRASLIVVFEFFQCHVDVVPHCFAILAALLATKRHVIYLQCDMRPWRLCMCAPSTELIGYSLLGLGHMHRPSLVVTGGNG
jgi:hypothetical protein